MNYEDALLKADIESLEDRREQLCKNCAEKSIQTGNTVWSTGTEIK